MNSRISPQGRHEDAGRVFLVNNALDRFRWVGGRTEADAAALVRVRQPPVSASWKPVGVAWVPETARRLECDFPVFYSIVRCFSQQAVQTLSGFIDGGLEVLALDGLDGRYVGVHCIRWIEGAADLRAVDQAKVSIHSTNFLPRLWAGAVQGHDIFGVPEMIAKLFVSERFKDTVEQCGLVGFKFQEVELTCDE
jgi:hypothetical protein